MPVELPTRSRAALARAATKMTGENEVGKALQSIEEHKIAAAIELVKDLRAQGKRVLVFTLRRDSAKQIGEALDIPYVTGADAPGDRRAKLITKDAGVATVFSVTTGIDLVGFNVAVFVGLDWVPSTLLQAEARIHRIGQNDDVIFYYMIGLGTIDEVICSTVITRLDNFSTVVGSAKDEDDMSASLRGNKSEDDLIAEIISQVRAS